MELLFLVQQYCGLKMTSDCPPEFYPVGGQASPKSSSFPPPPPPPPSNDFVNDFFLPPICFSLEVTFMSLPKLKSVFWICYTSLRAPFAKSALRAGPSLQSTLIIQSFASKRNHTLYSVLYNGLTHCRISEDSYRSFYISFIITVYTVTQTALASII